MIVLERKIKASHEHLVDYIENSFRFSPSPNPPMEKSDIFHYGVKTSIRVFTVKGYTVITVISVNGISSVTAHIYGDDNVDVMLDCYKPDAAGKENNYWKQVR